MTHHLGDILTLILGKQLSPSAPGLSGPLALMDHVYGHKAPVSAIRPAMAITAEHLRTEFPALAELSLPDGADRTAWLAVQVERFGEQHEVRPIPSAEYALTATTKES